MKVVLNLEHVNTLIITICIIILHCLGIKEIILMVAATNICLPHTRHAEVRMIEVDLLDYTIEVELNRETTK